MKREVLITWKLLLVLCVSGFILPNYALSQIRNCNVFLKSQYVQVGVNWNGAFGSSTTPPAGYVVDTFSGIYNATACGGSRRADSAIGLMCDPDRDGWRTGSPSYLGDFVLRGGNQEGWSYMADGSQINGWNKSADTSNRIVGMNCAQISYIDSGYLVKSTWQGIASGLYLTQITTVDSQNLYVKVQVIIENTTLSSFADVYYMRTINAHPDAASGSFNAVHKIEYTQPDSLNRVLVSSRGITNSQSYISLSTTDDRAKAFIAKNSILPTANTIDNIAFGDTNFLYRKNDSVVGNVCIGLIYDFGIIPSGGSRFFTFYYNFVKKTDTTHINAVNMVEHLPIALYPNPTSDWFSITGIARDYWVNVYDPVGRKVAHFKTLHSGESYDISHLQTGCYVIEVKNMADVVVYRNQLVKY